jgi:SAM-dependent methyltransferase
MAEHFDRFAELVGGPLDEFIDSQLPEGGGQRAVDLGCGTGRHAALLARRYRQVVAVDVSAPMLELAMARRGLANIDYQQRDLCEVRADTDGAFDLVLSAYALHHLDDLDEALHAIRALIAPGGRVMLIDNVAPTPQVSRRWFVSEAIRTLAADLLQRRRPPGQAWELLRLNLDRAWLDHLTSDRFLSPQQFADRYGEVFPGATFTDLYRARTICWEQPRSTWAPTEQPRGNRWASTPARAGDRRHGERAPVSAQPAPPETAGGFAAVIRAVRRVAGLSIPERGRGLG